MNCFCSFSVGVSRYWLRLFWDSSLFHLVIKKRGRVPAGDSFVVKRIAGPGLASDYHFQIRPEQALAAFEAKMEWDEMAAYQYVMEQTILQPQKDFGQFVEACFGSFSTQLAKNGAYKVLEKEAQDLMGVLHEKLERRRRDLNTGLSVTVKSKIKLSTPELKVKRAPLLDLYQIKSTYFVDCYTARSADARAVLSCEDTAKAGMFRGTVLGKSWPCSRRLGRIGGASLFGTVQSRHFNAAGSHRYKFQARS